MAQLMASACIYAPPNSLTSGIRVNQMIRCVSSLLMYNGKCLPTKLELGCLTVRKKLIIQC